MTENFDVNDRIKQLCNERNFSYYELAKRAEIPYSTLNTMLLKSNQPSLSTIKKLCKGFDISLLQFFNTEHTTIALSDIQKECLSLFDIMSSDEKTLVLTYMKGILHRL